MILEAKYQITSADAALPLAVLLVSTLPTGDEAVSVGSTEIGFKLAAAYDLSERMGLGFNLGAISYDNDKARKILSLASVSLGIGLSDRVGGFVELLAEAPEDQAWQPLLDGGLTYAFTPDVQLDLYAGKGLNDDAADLIIGGGISFRFGY